MSEGLIMANLPDILDIDQFLGAGSYCWVYTCRYKPGCENSLCGIPASDLVIKVWRDKSIRPLDLKIQNQEDNKEYHRYQDFSRESIYRHMVREVSLLRDMRHPQLVRFFGYTEYRNNLGHLTQIHMVLQRARGTAVHGIDCVELQNWIIAHGKSLATYIFEYKNYASICRQRAESEHDPAAKEQLLAKSHAAEMEAHDWENKIRLITYQIFSGLVALHASGILHRDLKPDNILVDGDCTVPMPGRDLKVPRVLLSDFGLSRKDIENGIDMKTSFDRGSGQYSPPEIWNQKTDYNMSVDIWAAGVVLFATLTCSLPFTSRAESSNEEKIFVPRMEHHDESRRWARHRLYKDTNNYRAGIQDLGVCEDLIGLLLKANPLERPSALQALSHVWFDPIRNEVASPDGPFRDRLLVKLGQARDKKDVLLLSKEDAEKVYRKLTKQST